MNVERRNQLLSIVLGIIILVLGYFLYQSIVGPYQEVIERQQMTERVRHQMSTIRDALTRFEQEQDSFPQSEGGLDTLVSWLKTDSSMAAMSDSLFRTLAGNPFNIDSLAFSVRPPHNKFQYTLNDTIRPPLYLLEDPDTDDRIGDLERTTLLNAASWE